MRVSHEGILENLEKAYKPVLYRQLLYLEWLGWLNNN